MSNPLWYVIKTSEVIKLCREHTPVCEYYLSLEYPPERAHRVYNEYQRLAERYNELEERGITPEQFLNGADTDEKLTW